MQAIQRRQRGISLVEALVAMLVMSFGMLAIVGLQATMRQNADIAKQRSEAVRIAQVEVERWRGFTTFTGGVDDESFNNLASSAADVDIAGQNATYTLSRTVTDSADGNFKTLVVDVVWLDRVDAPQSVRLSTTLVGAEPVFAATVGIPSPALPARSLGARRAEIPMQARDLGNGTSGFIPPGGGGSVWVFGNTTGVVRVCTTTSTDTAGLTLGNISGCGTTRYLPLSGFVRFSLTTPPDAVAPSSPALPVNIQIVQTAPLTQTFYCPTPELDTSFATYYCIVQAAVSDLDPAQWSGRSLVVGLPGTTQVCRYGPDSSLVVPTDVDNIDHPNRYVDVDGPLANQNFLVIPATASCPATTWPHS
jgi:Tfp pilus assembly protein PilV